MPIRQLLLAPAALLFVGAMANAQVNNPPVNVATTASVQALAAQIPQPAMSVPGMEVVGGAVGTAGTYRPGNSIQPRITRTVTCTTVLGGTCAVTWADMGAVPVVMPVPLTLSGATQGSMCFPVTGSVTSTGATIKCFTTQSVTVSILGATVAPLTTAASGVTVQVLAIPLS